MDLEFIKATFALIGFMTGVNVLSLILGYSIISAFRDIVRHIAEIKRKGE